MQRQEGVTDFMGNKEVRQLSWGSVSIRLDNRLSVKEGFLCQVLRSGNLPKCRLLLILDTENGFPGRRGVTFAMPDMKYAAPIRGVNNAYDRKRIGKHNISNWRRWDYAIYIPRVTAEKWNEFGPYFTLVLGHELEHIRIMLKNLEFHRCVSWLFDDNYTIFKEAGLDCKSKKKWQFPLELHCNKQGKRISEDIFGKKGLVECLTRLMPYETDDHKKYLEFILKLKDGSKTGDICENILSDIQKYYQKIEEAVHKVWEIRNSLGQEFVKQFDLQKFIPLKRE